MAFNSAIRAAKNFRLRPPPVERIKAEAQVKINPRICTLFALGGLTALPGGRAELAFRR